jgi:hypothetical protein
VYKDHGICNAKFEDDIVNEVEIFFEGLDNGILCTIENRKLRMKRRNEKDNSDTTLSVGLRSINHPI